MDMGYYSYIVGFFTCPRKSKNSFTAKKRTGWWFKRRLDTTDTLGDLNKNSAKKSKNQVLSTVSYVVPKAKLCSWGEPDEEKIESRASASDVDEKELCTSEHEVEEEKIESRASAPDIDEKELCTSEHEVEEEKIESTTSGEDEKELCTGVQECVQECVESCVESCAETDSDSIEARDVEGSDESTVWETDSDNADAPNIGGEVLLVSVEPPESLSRDLSVNSDACVGEERREISNAF
jgi:hypothetical protein